MHCSSHPNNPLMNDAWKLAVILDPNLFVSHWTVSSHIPSLTTWIQPSTPFSQVAESFLLPALLQCNLQSAVHSPPIKCGLCSLTFFQTGRYGKWGKVTTLDTSDKHNLGQVINVNFNSDSHVDSVYLRHDVMKTGSLPLLSFFQEKKKSVILV